MAHTYNTHTGDNSTTVFSFTFPYLDQSHVKVYVNEVLKTYVTDWTFASATQVQFVTAPASSANIRIARETDASSPEATFYAGSSVRHTDLNDNQSQVLYSVEEIRENIWDKTIDTVSSTETWVGNNDKVATTGATDSRIDEKIDTALTTDVVAGNAITVTDNSPGSGQITIAVTDGQIDTAELTDGAVTTAKLGADAVTGAKLADDAVDSEHYVDGSIDTVHIGDLQVTTAKIAADAVTNAKIADDSIDSEHYVDGSIDTAHIADSQVTTAKIADANVTTAKITDANVTTAKLADSSVTTAKIADDSVTTAKIADSAVTIAKIADAELSELATMGGLTAAALADLTQAEVQILDGATVTTAELNTLDGITATFTELNQLDGNTLTNSPTWTSTTEYPSAASIDSRITSRVNAIGGYVAIDDEDSFPATAPDAGTVVSIANANSLAVNASGVGAGTRAGGTDPVVINGFPSGFNSTNLDDGIGLLVVATSTAHTYDFHRVVAKNEDVRQLSSDINDFKARYRIGTSNPTTDLDAGDLFFNTSTSKMLVYDAADAAWEEVQSIGEFFINTLSSSAGTGGGSATFNGTAYRFTLSNPPTLAQQLLVSVNGVVQKPNSGTAQPSEGFALDGSDIIFAAAPATSAPFFIITIGSSVNIGTPSAGTVGTSQLADGGVTTAKIAADAVNGTKIADDSIDSEHYVDGSIDTAHIADDAVTAAKLADTTVTAGSYTLSSITVDAQGRITAASSGSAGASDAITEGNTSVEVVDSGVSNGEVRLTTDGTRAMTIDSSQRVGIGTTTPDSILHLGFSNSTAPTSGTTPSGIGMSVGGTNGDNGGIWWSADFGGDQGIAGIAGTKTNSYQTDLRFYTNNTNAARGFSERARIDSSGRLLVGSSTNNAGYKLQVVHTDSTGVLLGSFNGGTNYLSTLSSNGSEASKTIVSNGQNLFTTNVTGYDGSAHRTAATISAFVDGTPGAGDMPGRLVFSTTADGASSPTERVRITEKGVVHISNTGSGPGTNPSNRIFYGTAGNDAVLIENSASDPYTININHTTATNSSSNYFFLGRDNGAQRFGLRTNGGLHNYSGNNVNLSDEREKKNIVDLDSTWDCLKNWELKKFHYNEDADDADLRYGVIAQQVAPHCPEVISDWVKQDAAEAELDEDGNVITPAQEEIVRMGVKEQQMYWMAIKALQEAQTRIETLETANASLEARLTALEGGN